MFWTVYFHDVSLQFDFKVYGHLKHFMISKHFYCDNFKGIVQPLFYFASSECFQLKTKGDVISALLVFPELVDPQLCLLYVLFYIRGC